MRADPGHGEVFQPPHITRPRAGAISRSSLGPWAAAGQSPAPPAGNLWRGCTSDGMSLRKEDNKALEEIKVRSFCCESGGQTASNPAAKGRSRAFKSPKPRLFGLSRELPSSSAAPSAARLGAGGSVPGRGHIPNPGPSLRSGRWHGSEAVHLFKWHSRTRAVLRILCHA